MEVLTEKYLKIHIGCSSKISIKYRSYDYHFHIKLNLKYCHLLIFKLQKFLYFFSQCQGEDLYYQNVLGSCSPITHTAS